MRQCAWIAGVVLLASLAGGCVERRYVITSDPPGALVYRNGQPIGATPADDHFPFYGKYDFTLVKDGYETLKVEQKIPAPWYQYFPLDFFTEALLPCNLTDVRRFHYQMSPRQAARPDELLNKGQVLRDRGKTIGEPAPLASMPLPAPAAGTVTPALGAPFQGNPTPGPRSQEAP